MVLPNVSLILIVIALSCAGSFHFGYIVIIPNQASVALKEFINNSFADHFGSYLYENEFRFLWPMFINLFPFGGLLGVLMLRQLSERIGRKSTFFIVACCQSVACALSGISHYAESWELLALGRFMSGFSVGISMCLQPTYFSEISPKAVRGFLNATTGTMLEFGFCLGSILALPALFGLLNSWHWIFWIELLFVIPTFIALIFIPESPKYLLASKGDYIKCREALVYFKHEKVDRVIEEIETDINIEKRAPSLRTIFKKSYLRKGLLIGSLCIVAGQCSGIQAISFYSTYLLQKAGVPDYIAPYATVAVTFNTVLAAVVSTFLVDRVGRRPLLLTSLVSLATLNLIFAIFTHVGKRTGATWPGYICIADNLLFTFVFGAGPAVVGWFIIAEMIPQNARSKAVAFAQMMHWVFSGLVNAIFYPLEGVIHEWSFFIFIVILVFASVYLYFKFPETKNKTTVEIVTMLGYKSNEQELQELNHESYKEKL